MKRSQNLKKVSLILYSIVSILFLIVGVVMLFVDHNYVNGSQYIITTLVFSAAMYLIAQNRVNPNYLNPMLSLGFVCSIIGLTRPLGSSLHVGLWAFGILLFLSGLFNNPEEGDKEHEHKT